MKTGLLFLFQLISFLGFAQSTGVDFDLLDSLIATTPEIALCKKEGKEDTRFFSKAPERYSDYKKELMKLAGDTFAFDPKSHFFCDITVEVNCKGKAGNYDFAFEPRTFTPQHFAYLKQLIAFVNRLRDYTFKPAFYLGEDVNSKVRFRLMAKEGKLVMQ